MLTIKEARLKRNTDFFSKMDPYVIVKCGGLSKKTSVLRNAGKFPHWNEVSTLLFYNQKKGALI